VASFFRDFEADFLSEYGLVVEVFLTEVFFSVGFFTGSSDKTATLDATSTSKFGLGATKDSFFRTEA